MGAMAHVSRRSTGVSLRPGYAAAFILTKVARLNSAEPTAMRNRQVDELEHESTGVIERSSKGDLLTWRPRTR